MPSTFTPSVIQHCVRTAVSHCAPQCPGIRVLAVCVALLFPLFGPGTSADELSDTESQARTEFFEKRIRPVLVRYCYECHSGGSPVIKGNLRVDFRDGLRKGGDSGPAIDLQNADDSLLLNAIRHEGLEMPPNQKLPDSVIQDLEQWVRDGALDPRSKEPALSEVSEEAFRAVYQERLNWWAFQPMRVPEASQSTSLHAEIDAMIQKKLHQESLEPAPPATASNLLRRLSFTVTGLPPSVGLPDSGLVTTQKFTASEWETLVNQALNSPHFGERWARHWMDVVRYTDTYGYEWDMPAKGAWRFRDYLVRAFNQDIPFDTLIREQIAGDLLPNPRLNRELGINESLIGPMFYQLGEKRHGDSSEFNGIHQEMLDNKVDAFGKTFLATTISCARCHDHKLDPVSQRDYYALAGTFFSSRWVSNTIDLPQRHEQQRARLEELKAAIRNRLAKRWLKNAEHLNADQLNRLCEQQKPASFEDPLYVYDHLRSTDPNRAETSLQSLWNQLRQQCVQESDRRAGENRGHFAEVADFRNGIPTGWSVSGEGLRSVIPRGDFVIGLKDQTIVDAILYGGLATNSLSPKFNGALRSPWTKDLGPGHLSFEVAGGEFAARRVVVDNAFLTEKQQYVNSPFPQWTLIDGMSGLTDRHIYVEFATKTSNPNFPPRVGLGGACSEEQAADPRSWFQITRVVKHVAPFSPFNELRLSRQILESSTPQSPADVVLAYRQRLQSAVTSWHAQQGSAEQQCSDEDVSLLNWAVSKGLLVNSIESFDQAGDSEGLGSSEGAGAVDEQIGSLINEYRTLEASLEPPQTVNGMADLDTPFNYRLNIRGDYDQLGDEVPRDAPLFLRDLATVGSPAAIAGSQTTDRNSATSDPIFNRQVLADLVVSPHNPLTARVYVNRVWHWLFEQGLVRTPDDFGHAGDQPVHRELLDLLAYRFVEHGWSTRYLIREILLTKTWQQSQQISGTAMEIDPHNRLHHHFPVTRLDAESLRDTILAVSGDLETGLYGPTVYPWRQNEDPQKRLFSGPLDGNRRRSIYTQVSIMEPPRFLQTFNQPAPKIPTGKRDATNTPAQSLTLLNDPFVLEQSSRWARSLIAESHAENLSANPEIRIHRIFQQALGRSPAPEELTRWCQTVQQLADSEGIRGQDVMENEGIWQVICHAMFNTKEFLYVQ